MAAVQAGVVVTIALGAFFFTVSPIKAQQLPCLSDVIPLAATAEQPRAIFCLVSGTGTDTAVRGANTWRDDFTHGQTLTNFPTSSYKVFETLGGVAQSKHWLHANHWMVDIAPSSTSGVGGAMIRPDATFTFQNGVLSVEHVVSAGHQDYTVNDWHEVILTNAAAPQTDYYKGLYGYEQFTGSWSLGMRMQADRLPIVALFRPDGTRAWEASFWQLAGKSNYGGGPWGELATVWRECQKGTMDMGCRDAFRWEVRPTAITLYVNGVKYWDQTGLPQLPDELITGNTYVYAASIAWREPAQVVRYHWDNMRINVPMGSPEPTMTPTPTATPSPSPTMSAEKFAQDMTTYFGVAQTTRNSNYFKRLYTSIRTFLGILDASG